MVISIEKELEGSEGVNCAKTWENCCLDGGQQRS